MNNLPPFKSLEQAKNDELEEILGPLYNFIGTWKNDPQMGWNIIAIPGPDKLEEEKQIPGFMIGNGFILETIPYSETLTFKPIGLITNAGQYEEGKAKNQQIGGLLYEQEIRSDGLDGLNPDYPWKDGDGPQKQKDAIREKLLPDFFKRKELIDKEKPIIHKEVGMLLYLKDYETYKIDSKGKHAYSIARMGTIPHGNTMLCLGNSNELGGKGFPDYKIHKEGFPPIGTAEAYDDGTYKLQPTGDLRNYPFSELDPILPHNTLNEASKKLGLQYSKHFDLSTKRGSGGLLSIPFLKGGGNPGQDVTAIDTVYMDAEYWLSQGKDGNDYLQYFQNIGLNFPITNGITQIKWPHIGLNTLKRIKQ